MAAPRTPQRSRLAPSEPADSSSLRSMSPSRPSAVHRVQRPGASASPQIKAALAALRKNRQASNSPSLNLDDGASDSPTPDPFSTPPRASSSNTTAGPSNARETSPVADRDEAGDFEWARKNETRLIDAAKKTGLLNLASQGLENFPRSVYSTLLPRSSPYHPSRRHRSTYKQDPTPTYSFSRDDNETAWFEQADLKSLNLANNELAVVDEEVGGFEDLEFLDLHGNLLTSIPPSLGYLVHLTSLNLASNSIRNFPLQIVNLRFLRDLDLSHNKLEKLWTSTWESDLAQVLVPPETSPSATPESPERIRDFFANSDSPFRRSQQPDSSPSSTSPFPLLQSLKLSGSAFDKCTFTSNGFEFPPRLKTLDLSSSQLIDTSLPPALLGRLADLTELDLSDNGLTEDLFSSELFPLDSSERFFPSLRTLDLSLNPIDHLQHIEEFLTANVARPIEYVGLAKVVLNLVKSEEQRLRGGKRIGLKLESEAEEETIGVEVEVRLRECMLRGEQERRRAKFPSREGSTPSTISQKAGLSVPPTSRSVAASPSSSPPRSQDLSRTASMGEQSQESPTTPSRKQVVLEPWEVEAASGLSTPAGRRKAAAQAAREKAERLKQEQEEKQRLKEERIRMAKLELEEKQAQEAREIEQEMEKTTLEESGGETRDEMISPSPSPPPYSPRLLTELPKPRPQSQATDEASARPAADPSDPAFLTISSAYNTATRAVNLSSRSLSALPTLTNGAPPASLPAPSSLDLSRNVLTAIPLLSIGSWNWSSTLRTLTLSHNRISALFEAGTTTALPSLDSLISLDLSYNSLASTSTSPSSSKPSFSQIGSLFPSLRSLSLSHNRLTSLEGIDALLLSPDEASTPRLQTLSLQGNKISDISCLCQVAERFSSNEEKTWSLEQLDLSDNEIARLPPTLGLLPHSLILSVSGNTFRFPRREYWENPGARLLLPNLRERLG
ncbi:hypothetical protein JCM16303_005981 [Sporobolomyces ruberrimus]